MPLLPCAHIRKKLCRKISSKCKPGSLRRAGHSTSESVLNLSPPKTRSREEAGRRKRRLGRIDSFSREHTEPFPGWQQAGGAAHTGERREGARAHRPQPLPAPRRRAQWSPARARPCIRGCPLFPLLFGAPQVGGSSRRRMNESERRAPTPPPAPCPCSGAGRAAEDGAEGPTGASPTPGAGERASTPPERGCPGAPAPAPRRSRSAPPPRAASRSPGPAAASSHLRRRPPPPVSRSAEQRRPGWP